MDNTFKVALICGGPSLERGISLNSARSVMDHTQSDAVSVIPFYVDKDKNFYEISKAQLYSNTPEDFDFKLSSHSTPLNLSQLKGALKSCDIVFSVIHGPFGEDGEIQKMLEEWSINFAGPTSEAAKLMFNKFEANQTLRKNGFFTIDAALLDPSENYEQVLTDFWNTSITDRAIIKPIAGGSSLGVCSIFSLDQALEHVKEQFKSAPKNPLIIEPFCKGKEFTLCVLENEAGEPVSLVPSEIHTCYKNGSIFDYRRKYLPTGQVAHYCPPRFKSEVIQKIRSQAQEIFKLFNMRDFTRIDGWVLEDGSLWFSDINPISGMEQNSFLFQQSSRIGMAHEDLIGHILKIASKRGTKPFPKNSITNDSKKRRVQVLFGGPSAERQVSLMSGTNAWFKLRRSKKFDAHPYLLDKDNSVWSLPYAYTLNHTVEEILENCKKGDHLSQEMSTYAKDIRQELGLPACERSFTPKKTPLSEFIQQAQDTDTFIYLGLHGCPGEDGTLQSLLDEASISYNGSKEMVSRLCMDKYKTADAIEKLGHPDIITLPKKIIHVEDSKKSLHAAWDELVSKHTSNTCIIKPQSDGCSAGIVHLKSKQELEKYINQIIAGHDCLPSHTFAYQSSILEMPRKGTQNFILEPFVETDSIQINRNTLTHTPNTGWLELTVGLQENKGQYRVFAPSITVAQSAVLSVEEKFQGGTGINITPPPTDIFPEDFTKKIQSIIETIAKSLAIKSYARIDLFANLNTEKIIVIEINSLPAITPSTVIFQQALKESPPIYPRQFFEMAIESSLDN